MHFTIKAQYNLGPVIPKVCPLLPVGGAVTKPHVCAQGIVAMIDRKFNFEESLKAFQRFKLCVLLNKCICFDALHVIDVVY